MKSKLVFQANVDVMTIHSLALSHVKNDDIQVQENFTIDKIPDEDLQRLLNLSNDKIVDFKKCFIALSDVALSVEYFLGLLIKLILCFKPIFNIFFESELKKIFLIFLDFFACNIVHSINGLPQKSFKFLFGIPLDPPLAKIIASTFINF